MLNHWDRMFFRLAELQRQSGADERHGYVKEVKGDKIRVVMGIKRDGKELLSPWLDTHDHRGGNRERHQYEKGQNVRISALGGSYRNATVSASGVSKSFPAPDHANDVNGHSGQAGKTAFAFNKSGGQQGGSQGGSGGGGGGGGSGSDGDYVDHMIFEQANQNPQHQDQTGELGSSSGGQQSQQGGQQQQQKPTAAMKSRIHEKTGITHRYGKNVRLFASEKEAIIAYGESMENTVFCNETGCFSTKPIQIKKPQAKPDNN